MSLNLILGIVIFGVFVILAMIVAAIIIYNDRKKS